MLNTKHQSIGYSRNEKDQRYRETLYGTKEEIMAALDTFVIGSFYAAKGALVKRDYTPTSADMAELSMEYMQEYNDEGKLRNPQTATGPSSQKLSCRNISLPLESKRNKDGSLKYRCYWNNYLIGLGAYARIIPPWQSTATDTFIDPLSEDFKHYRWIKNLSELPTEAAPDGFFWQIVKQNNLICIPTMPGQDSYDFAIYVITERGRHSSKEKAGWAASGLINTIIPKPLLGDFGLTKLLGGDWKIDDVSIEYDGMSWIAERAYTKSGDALGWNKQLYDEYEGEL